MDRDDNRDSSGSSPEGTDNADNGRRGLRAQPSPGLLNAIQDRYGLGGADEATDLGGSSNLNLLVRTGQKKHVVRVYRPYVSPTRLADIQRARRELAQGGVPCPDVLSTREGEPWTQLGGRLIEVEEFVERDAKMDSWERLQAGLPTLGRIHTLLQGVRLSPESATPLFANHVEAGDALAWAERAARRIRAWSPSAEELSLARDTEDLARALSDAEREAAPSLRRGLAHGDFWDNNVFFRAGRVVLVADFDFMGERALIDDLALTLYFTSLSLEQAGHLGKRIAQLRQLVNAYDSGLDDPLSSMERAALPLAMARQPLWAAGRWLSVLDDQRQARRLASELPHDVAWGQSVLRDLGRWQDGFA